MAYKVIKTFIDKETNKLYEVGSEYDGTATRKKEIEKLGYIENTTKPKKEQTTTKKN